MATHIDRKSNLDKMPRVCQGRRLTEIQQIDEADYEPRNAANSWTDYPQRPCRWGFTGHPSNRLKAAFGGDTSVADPSDGKRCEEIMAKTLAR